MKSEARIIALGGVMAALAVTVMSLGGMIPVATYVIPMLCMLLARFVLKSCGSRIAWAWYGAVAILGLLLCPDKEAAAVFAVLGYYPIVKPKLDKLRLAWLWKGLLFNSTILLLYWALMHLFGMAELSREFEGMGTAMLAALLAMGNLVFFLMDMLLGRRLKIVRN